MADYDFGISHCTSLSWRQSHDNDVRPGPAGNPAKAHVKHHHPKEIRNMSGTAPPAPPAGTSTPDFGALQSAFATAQADAMKVTEITVQGNAALDAAKARPQG